MGAILLNSFGDKLLECDEDGSKGESGASHDKEKHQEVEMGETPLHVGTKIGGEYPE